MVGYGSHKSSRQMGWLRHVLTVLSVVIFLLGCIVIGYISWVLVTSVTMTKLVSGSMVWTYTVLTLGFSLFLSGLIGWVGGASESPCLVRMFLIFISASMLAEVVGIITLNIMGQGFDDILEQGWEEVNQGTRNIIQNALSCCGWRGLDEFKNNEPIADSCYERITPGVAGILSRLEEETLSGSSRRMKQEPCMTNLHNWIMDNKISWVTILATLAAVQVMCVGISLYILQRVSKMRKVRDCKSLSKRKLYSSSCDGSLVEARYRGGV